MFTRNLRQPSTRKQKIGETQKKIKVMPRQLSKTKIRKLIKNRLRAKIPIKTQRISQTDLPQNTEKRECILELIDHSKCECPICLQIAINPIVLPCGHCYCLKCFQENSILNLRCCLCRLEVSSDQILPAKMIQGFIDRFILPASTDEISYWCRKGEFQEWEIRRKVDHHDLRVGDNIDVRTDDNKWRRGVIMCLLFQQDEYCVEIKYCSNAKIETVLIPASSRRLAPNGFFTKGHYLKYRTICYESKFVQSIEIPEIECDFKEEYVDPMIHQEKWSHQQRNQQESPDLALELFQYEMKQWQNVFQLS